MGDAGEVQRLAWAGRAVSVGRGDYPGPRREGRGGNGCLTRGGGGGEGEFTWALHEVAAGQYAARLASVAVDRRLAIHPDDERDQKAPRAWRCSVSGERPAAAELALLCHLRARARCGSAALALRVAAA